MVTAIANQWNLISGTVFSDGGDVELILGNMPADSDLWFDDFAVANCGMEAAHSDAKIDEVRRRTTRVNIGKSGAETAKITMLKHEFPFGGAMWDDCVDSDNCKAFVKEHFNTIVAETGMKWWDEEPEDGDNTGTTSMKWWDEEPEDGDSTGTNQRPHHDACNGMKWWDEEPEDGDNTGTGEKYKEVARELGVELRAHSTYWEDNYKVQDWVKNLPRDGSRDSLQYAIWRRMQQYVERYGDQYAIWRRMQQYVERYGDQQYAIWRRMQQYVERYGDQYAIWRRMQQYMERYGDQVSAFDVNNEMLHGTFYKFAPPPVSAFDVNNEMLHGTFYKDALPCGGDGPCMCDLEDACPDGMDVDRDADVHTWMYKAMLQAASLDEYLSCRLRSDGMGVDRDADVHTWMYKAMKYLLPDSRRFINDYCQMHYCSKHFALAKLVKEARDIPDVTDMGVQGHLTNSMTVCGLDLMARFDHAVAAINGGATDGSASLRDLYDAPRKMWVTEMDMQDKDVTRRADGYETFYRAAYGSPGVAGVMTWGWREGHEWRPDIAMVGEDYRLTLEPGQRIFQGLLKGAWDASQDSTAVYPPDGEGDAPHVYFGAFPGTYTISAGGCTGSFTVPVGLGDYEVDAGNWEC
ncbi:glycoside hydrolase superfamily [Tribonema minus]|uniref:Glycoside hydrolase superfamily n=1 Tax=Tribonema minus TaxID=303371 RepID=A0A835Z8G3_9STRA|nr:glycoside hydrolase superfamily [Tribonema minus]